MTSRSQLRLDLLAWRPARALLMARGFPVVLQALALAVVVALVGWGFGVGTHNSAEELLTLRKTNLTTLVVWGLWWPGMILSALAFGRAWCTVCPMELVNRLGDAVARRIGWPRARIGRFLRSGWLVVVAYLALQLLVAGLSIHRVPHFTAILLLALIGSALLAGLVFREPRSFCSSFCPASALLSVYGRYTPLQLEMHDPKACDQCPTRDCVRAENRYKLDRRSCPSLLRPFDHHASDGCVLCLQCAKVCPYRNMGVGWVAGDAKVRRKQLLRPFEAAFVMLALGFVSHELVGEVKWLDAVFHRVPEVLRAAALRLPFGWFEAVWFLVLFPLAIWALIAATGHLAGHRTGLRSLLLGAATGAAPVVAVAHVAKAAAKVTSWGGFLPLTLCDPKGTATLRRLAERSLPAPPAWLGLGVVGWAMLAVMAVVTWEAWHWVRQVPAESVIAARTGAAGATVLFATMLSIWGWPGR